MLFGVLQATAASKPLAHMALKSKDPKDAPAGASSGRCEALNALLARGKEVQRQRKKAAASSSSGHSTGDYPLDTLLLLDGSCDITLEGLMTQRTCPRVRL